MLKSARGLSRNDAGIISRSVFIYYRWRGWLDENTPLPNAIRHALELDRAFQSNEREFPVEEMHRAIPSWISSEMTVTPEWLRSLQREPNLWLRARPGAGRELACQLGHCSPAGGGWPDEILRYQGSQDLFRTPEFHRAEFELQDISSQIVGTLCDPRPGEIWWDACAGEGGKTLHLADLMASKGCVWASDRAEWRLRRLKLRAARAKVFNYRVASWDGGATLPTKTKFDGILMDAPCSGIGTWQRNPHARWTTTLQDVKELEAVQKRLLDHAAPALKPGGRLIYSVCTLARSETHDVAEAFGQRHGEMADLTLETPRARQGGAGEYVELLPQEIGGNAMYVRGWLKRPAQ